MGNHAFCPSRPDLVKDASTDEGFGPVGVAHEARRTFVPRLRHFPPGHANVMSDGTNVTLWDPPRWLRTPTRSRVMRRRRRPHRSALHTFGTELGVPVDVRLADRGGASFPVATSGSAVSLTCGVEGHVGVLDPK